LSVEDQWSDVDGEYRREQRRVDAVALPDDVTMTERAIERGARVCVFGPYSAERRAIVADPRDWSKIVRVMKGDPDAVVRQLGASVVRRLIGTVVFAAIATAVIAMFIAAHGRASPGRAQRPETSAPGVGVRAHGAIAAPP
jgi:hypothetical protein